MTHRVQQAIERTTLIMSTLDRAERSAVIQFLAVCFMGGKLQICSWCFTGYKTPDEASSCARRCSAAAAALPRFPEHAQEQA